MCVCIYAIVVLLYFDLHDLSLSDVQPDHDDPLKTTDQTRPLGLIV